MSGRMGGARSYSNEVGEYSHSRRETSEEERKRLNILSAILNFLNAPLHHSLWWLALIGWGTATLIIVFVVSMVGMMLGIGNLILGNAIVILFALSGFLLFGRELK